MLVDSTFAISFSTKNKIKKYFGLNLKKFKKTGQFLKINLQENSNEFCNRLKIEKDFKINSSNNVKFLKDIRSFRGIRHLNKLPCRGQRTRTNAKTRKRLLSKT